MRDNIESKEKGLSALAYVFGIPSLYIVLTAERKKEYVGFHGGQALILWVWYFVIFFSLRFLINLIWSLFYFAPLVWLETVAVSLMAVYALYCGYRAAKGQNFSLPH